MSMGPFPRVKIMISKLYKLVSSSPAQHFVRHWGCGKSSSLAMVDLRKLCNEGRLEEALHMLEHMTQQGIPVFSDTYICLLQGCIRMKALATGKQVHAHINNKPFNADIFLRNNLINMYAKCGSLMDACLVFDTMPKRSVVSWNVMIGAYVQYCFSEEAFKLFWKMQQEGVKPNYVTFTSVLKACTSLAAVAQIHAYINTSGCDSDVVVGSTLVNMYAKCGSLSNARMVFDNIISRNVVSWNTMITGYAQHGHAQDALQLFRKMQQDGMHPNKVTFIGALDACASLAFLEHGKNIHALIIRNGYDSDVIIGSTLINMYFKCGDMVTACQVFEKMPKYDAVCWTAMIIGFTKLEYYEHALSLFWQMQQEGVRPDNFTYSSTLDACASLTALEPGKKIHASIKKDSCESNLFIASSLVNMYAKCGSVVEARQIFDRMSKRDVVSWNGMISGYARRGHAKEALALFWQMHEIEDPDNITFVCILDACSTIAALEQGMKIHDCIIKSGFESDLVVGSALVNMYTKCGSIESARQVFENMQKKNVISWTAIIAGYAQHGLGEEAVRLFQQMQQEGMKPNEVTYLGVLSACSHAGLFDEGRYYFYSMIQEYGLIPEIKHYACMVDLHGRAGCLEEALVFIRILPLQPTSIVWMGFLGASKIQGNVEVAKHVADSILDLEPLNDAACVLLSNAYATTGCWDNK